MSRGEITGLGFRRVTKRYGDVEALRGLDLEVAPGELMVLVGPSGSGKSTALRVAAGLERPTSGSVTIGGRDLAGVPPGERNVSMVFQSYALFPHLTIERNIGFGLAARRVHRSEIAARVRRAALTVGCEDVLERRPHQLSGGERQRVALARAIVREPDVFLLDEPLSNLDAQLRASMRVELKRLHTRLEATMLYVTHDQTEALTLGERIAVLGGGVLQQVGTPDEVYRRPANRFVATFIGTPAMNVFEVVEGRAGPFPLDSWVATEGRRLQAGIRPEHVILGEGVPARVQVVEEAGSEAFLHLEAHGMVVVARVQAEHRPAAGAAVEIAVRPADVHLFDAESGLAV